MEGKALILVGLAILLIAAGLALGAALILWEHRTGKELSGAIPALAGIGSLGAVVGGLVLLLVFSLSGSTFCSHLEVTWKRSGEYVSQRAINSMYQELWLDKQSGDILARGPGGADADRAYEAVSALAKDLAGDADGLSEADRDRVEEYAASFLRSSACD